jgi:glutaredoxin
MKRFPVFVAGLTVLVFLGGLFLFSKEEPAKAIPLPSSYEYFWGEGCPHCANVEEFLSNWENKDKVSIDKKEVWKDRQNAALMRERAEYCNLPLDSLGVPFLFTPEGRCIGGDEAIIEHFKGLSL